MTVRLVDEFCGVQYVRTVRTELIAYMFNGGGGGAAGGRADAPSLTLTWAASACHIDVVTALLAVKDTDGDVVVDINAADAEGTTALIGAALHGHSEVVTALCEAKDKDGHSICAAGINAVDNAGRTALYAASANGHLDIVTTLRAVLNKDGFSAISANGMNAASRTGRTALIGAALGGYTEIVTSLLSLKDADGVTGVDVNAADTFGTTALIGAALKGHSEIVTALCEVKDKDGHSICAARINAADNAGQTALYVASANGHLDIVATLRAVVTKDGFSAISVDGINAASTTAARTGHTPLIGAAIGGHTAIVTSLLSLKDADGHSVVNLNAADVKGRTALMLASDAGVVNALLGAKGKGGIGVNLGLRDTDGHTAHHHASVRGAADAEFTAALLDRLLPPCPKELAAACLGVLDVSAAYLNPEFDRCYCGRCYDGPATIDNEGPTAYVVPEPGWVRFGLKVGPNAEAQDVFNQWSACFHGVPSIAVLKSILIHQGLMLPGSVLIDGPAPKRLRSLHSAGREDAVVFTSPTIKYAGLKFYAEPVRLMRGGVEWRMSIVVQCRQKPGTFIEQGETMGFARNAPGHLAKHCPNVNLAEIEWKTEAERAVIPCGLLVRVWPKGKDPDAEAYSSPVDGPQWWANEQ